MYRRLLLIISVLLSLHTAILHAQETVEIRGTVRDSVSGAPLADVSLTVEGTPYGTATDSRGEFRLRYDRRHASLTVRCLGYETKTVDISERKRELIIMLSPASIELNNVTVRPRRERYTKRDNPAVELLRKVIEHKNDNRIDIKENYKAEIYDRLSLSFAKVDTNLEKDILLRKLPFIKDYLDTSALTGKPVLTVSLRESLSDYYHRRNPEAERSILKAKRQQGIDSTLDDSGMLSDNLDEILKGVNIFDNDISILLNRFVSPLSSTLAVSYYRYYILDTLDLGGDRCARLAFAPFNSESYSFTGVLHIMLDGSYSVRKVQLNVPRRINLNWVHQLRIEQEFQQSADSLWMLRQEDIYANFTAMPTAPELYAHRLRSFNKFDFEPAEADSVFRLLGTAHTVPGAAGIGDDFWQLNRPVPLRDREKAIESLVSGLRAVPAYNVLIKTLEILISGYIPTARVPENSRFDVGPVYSMYSSNYLEGSRFRIGGMTTAKLFRQWFAAGYLAYGKADDKFKYQGTLTYSFVPKDYHSKEAPFNNLSVMYGFDVNTPGQNFISGNDNMLLSQSVGERITQMQYIRKAEIRYEKEWNNRLSIYLWGRNERNRAAGTLQYTDAKSLDAVDGFTVSELGFQLRYAPGERPFNGRMGRDAIMNLSKDAPVFRFSHQTAIKGFLGSDYTYHHTEAGIEKRIWLSSFGHIDAVVRGGYIWNRLPFPLLIIPNTNQSAFIQPESFAMMRAMEFVADRYASFFLTYYMKGWILNHIPLVKLMRLREVVSLNGIYGGLSDRNNPALHPEGLFLFPEGSVPFGAYPYLEASFGVENIFKVLRIDYCRRLTYLDAPNITKGNIRIGLRFSF